MLQIFVVMHFNVFQVCACALRVFQESGALGVAIDGFPRHARPARSIDLLQGHQVFYNSPQVPALEGRLQARHCPREAEEQGQPPRCGQASDTAEQHRHLQPLV